jgi:hypothetical protein
MKIIDMAPNCLVEFENQLFHFFAVTNVNETYVVVESIRGAAKEGCKYWSGSNTDDTFYITYHGPIGDDIKLQLAEYAEQNFKA